MNTKSTPCPLNTFFWYRNASYPGWIEDYILAVECLPDEIYYRWTPEDDWKPVVHINRIVQNAIDEVGFR